ncbi:MAG: hypothetical protein ACE5I5_14050 [Candidatus Heimdallarchaeota archaeon]
MIQTRKLPLGLIVALIVTLGCLHPTKVSNQSPNKFLIYDGQIVYREEYSFQQYVEEYDIEFGMQQKVIMTVTVTNLGPYIVRFSQEIRFTILDAYQKVGETKYTPTSYAFRYRDAEDNSLAWFGDTDTHTTIFVRDVSKTTGMSVRSISPLGLRYVDAIAYYADIEVPHYPSFWYYLEFYPAQTHSSLYFENSTSASIGDHTLWGSVSEYINLTNRNTLIIIDEDIPDDAVEYEYKRYYDVLTGLQLGREWTYVTTTLENRHTRTLISQTVLDTIAPVIDLPNDLTFEAGTSDQMITWHPFDDHPATYSIRQDRVFVNAGVWNGSEISVDVNALSPGIYEFTCYVSDESGQLAMDSVRVTVSGGEEGDLIPIPGFSLIPSLLGLAALLWCTRRSKQ